MSDRKLRWGLEGRIYLQYWHWQPNGFRPWTPDLAESFFDDFRFLFLTISAF
jgi:hypothetical protein